ncbi:Presequence protease 1, chloroplastic/mitochondrial [Linum perenne]
MESSALLRSTSAPSSRSFFFLRRSSPLRVPANSSFSAASATCHRLLRPRSRLLHVVASSSSSSPLRSDRSFSARSVATESAPQFSTDVAVSDEVAEKFGFEKVSEQFIDECKSKAVLFKHKKTGAEVMSLSNDDENKAFGIVFRTPLKDSSGVAHIMEHSVLCGSRKYPLKEPFAELIKGSLSTYVNALTFPDRTCYPIASVNEKEFYNMADVYLDAVFFPKCVEDEVIFRQEGWHYELTDPSKEISYKGVVFNEMKGVYSDPDNVLGREVRRVSSAVFPDNTYGVDSGGDPKDIPKLTFEQFKEFHRKYYHPSNARIWFYGDDNPSERLRILSEYLDKFGSSSSPKESKIKPQRLFSEPIRVVHKYPASDGGDLKKKNIVCLNWLLSDKPLDLETELALKVLNHLLLGTPASPLMKILLESGLGDAFFGAGLEDYLLQPQFSAGLKGVAEENIQKVEDLILSTLEKLSEEGFENDLVDASMNTIEFDLRENNTGRFPRGLALMFRSIEKWLYDMDPFEPLKYEKPLMALKSRISKEGPKAVFSPLIEKFILNNQHRATLEMNPDPEKGPREESSEREILAKLKASMTEEDLAELTRATHELRLKQETPDSPEASKTFPFLRLDDIPKESTPIPIEVGEINGAKVLQHNLFTNDVLYTEIAFDMRSLKQELLPLVPLFCQSLLEMGTKDLTFVQLSQLIGSKTGGISVFPFTASIRGQAEPCSHIIVRGKAMAGRAEDLFNLMKCVLQEVQFTDKQRFKQFVSQKKAGMESRLLGGGHGIAITRLDGKFTTAGWISDQMGGVSYLEFLQALEQRVDQDWEGISASLDEIRTSLLSKNGCLVNLTADGRNLASYEKYVSKFLDFLPSNSPAASASWTARLPPGNEAIVVPSQVNFVGKAVNLYETGYQIHGSVYVISKHLTNTWLWDRVRLMGGAYGGACQLNPFSGVFYFMSWRDPNLLKTLDAYDATGGFLRDVEIDNDSLTKSIIGTIADVDPYQLPDAKGYNSMLRYLQGFTEEERRKRREQILSTSSKDFKEFADVIDAVKNKGVSVAVTSASHVDAAHRDYPGYFQVKKVL